MEWLIAGLLLIIVLQLWNLNILLRAQVGMTQAASDMNHENHARLYGETEAGFSAIRAIWRDIRGP